CLSASGQPRPQGQIGAIERPGGRGFVGPAALPDLGARSTAQPHVRALLYGGLCPATLEGPDARAGPTGRAPTAVDLRASGTVAGPVAPYPRPPAFPAPSRPCWLGYGAQRSLGGRHPPGGRGGVGHAHGPPPPTRRLVSAFGSA